MQQTNEIIKSLKREFNFCSNALSFYKKALKDFEKKYNLTTSIFLKKFEAGQLGDEADFFDWYAFSKLYGQLQKTKSAIRSALQ
jgi:hypothetical protein